MKTPESFVVNSQKEKPKTEKKEQVILDKPSQSLDDDIIVDCDFKRRFDEEDRRGVVKRRSPCRWSTFTLPDGTVNEYAAGVTAGEVVTDALGKKHGCLAARINDVERDLRRP